MFHPPLPSSSWTAMLRKCLCTALPGFVMWHLCFSWALRVAYEEMWVCDTWSQAGFGSETSTSTLSWAKAVAPLDKQYWVHRYLRTFSSPNSGTCGFADAEKGWALKGGGGGVEKLDLGAFLRHKCWFELLNWFWWELQRLVVSWGNEWDLAPPFYSHPV